MKKEIKIRQYYSSDEKQSLDLLLSKLPSRAAQAAFPDRQRRWRWQYYENPNYPDGEPILWVAVMDEKVVGLVCPLAVGVKTPKGIVMGSWCNDWIVSTETRGTGLGRRLEEKWQHTFPVALGRGWSQRAYDVSVTLGFATVSGFFASWFVLSRLTFARRLYRLKEYRNLRKLLSLPPKLSFGRPKAGPGEISVSGDMPNGTGDLWARVAEAYAFAVDRREAHLRWRYADHPSYIYEFLSLSDRDGLKGLAVMRVTDEPQPVGVITELIVDPARTDLVRSLFTAAVEHLRAEGACAVRADIVPKLASTVFSTPYTCLKQDLKILVYSDIPDLAGMGMSEARNWYLTCGDSDADF